MPLMYLKWAGWPLAALMFWFWIGVKEDLAAEIEACNTRVVTGALESERAAREALQANAADELASAIARAESAEAAALEAATVKIEAETAAETAMALNRRLTREARDAINPTDTQKCFDTANDPDFIRSLQN